MASIRLNAMTKLFLLFFFVFCILVNAVESADDGNRIACYPLNEIPRPASPLDRTLCLSKGCVWDDAGVSTQCYLPLDGSQSYGYEIASTPSVSGRGLTVDLRRRRLGGGTTPPSLYGGDIDEVTFEVIYYNDQSLGFAFIPKGAVKEDLRPPVPLNLIQDFLSVTLYTVQLASSTVGDPFDFQIIRRRTGAILFDSSMGGLTIAEQFLMISTKLPTEYLYGFGENTHDTFLHDMNYRMWPIFTRDHPPEFADVNLYGAHPFYMASEQDGFSHGVFLYNSHAMDVTTMPNPGLTFRTSGGLLEFFVFLGPEPETVVQQYTYIIGRSFMPPYFALGFQLSRWGYKNTDDIRGAIERTRQVDIPQDIQYADIDYMDGQRDFTIDPVNFGDLPALVDEVKKDGLRFVVILDPAIANDYDTFERGKAANVFIQWANSTLRPPNQPLDNTVLGNVWPESRVAFPDFFKSSTKQWWTNEIQLFYEKLKYDALWIDMNEVSNFYTNLGLPTHLNCPENKWDDPPYPTFAAYASTVSRRLSDRTLCMAVKLGENGEYLNYQVHSLYGYSQSIATQDAARLTTGGRSMVLSRSTFPGSGKYAGHWLGDNTARWVAMSESIIGMMEFNMFGIPYVGADICGFTKSTDEELCERWMELGAFYPFSRNHNGKNGTDQDPAQWPDTVAKSARDALVIRYRLLPYLYSLFFQSHEIGSTVLRPLYHEYPADLNARSISRQFLWGSGFMVSPVLEEGKTSVDVYFPNDVWYDYYTGAQVAATGFTTLNAPRNFINLHLRGGYILPAQKPARNTMLSRKNNFELVVSLKNNQASGRLYWDDGESIYSFENEEYQINTYNYASGVLSATVFQGQNWPGIEQRLDLIEVNGLAARPGSISINGVPVNSADYTFNDTTKRLTLICNLSMNVNWYINFQ